MRHLETTAAVNDRCVYCGQPVVLHPGVCPRVRAFEYDAAGQTVRVEFHDQSQAPLYELKAGSLTPVVAAENHLLLTAILLQSNGTVRINRAHYEDSSRFHTIVRTDDPVESAIILRLEKRTSSPK